MDNSTNKNSTRTLPSVYQLADLQPFKGMRVLITGDKGFVGTETKKYFEEKGLISIGYDIMDGKDIRDVQQLDQFFAVNNIQRVLHLAAIARFAEADKDKLLANETNVRGTEFVSKIASKYHIPLVFASTGSVYMPIDQEPPITEEFPVLGNSQYGCSKATAEEWVRRASNPYIILRYAHLYGKEKRMHGLIGGFLERIERGLAPTLYGGKQSNDFTYIKDIARANFLAVTAPWDKWNQAYNIGTGEELTAEQAGRIVCNIVGYKGKIEKKKGRTVDPGRFVYDCSKADTMLGFKAEFTFTKGLKDMFKAENKK